MCTMLLAARSGPRRSELCRRRRAAAERPDRRPRRHGIGLVGGLGRAVSIGTFSNPKNNPIPKLCAEGLKFAGATPGALAAMNKVAQPVDKQFAKDPATGRDIRQIEALGATMELPQGCAVK